MTDTYRKAGNRGICILEVVIAMAVLAMVTLAVTSTMQKAAEGIRQNEDYATARVMAENALECFKLCKTQEEFDAVFSQVTDGSCSFSGDYCTMTVTVDYTIGNFSAVCRKKNGAELFNLQYNRQPGQSTSNGNNENNENEDKQP